MSVFAVSYNQRTTLMQDVSDGKLWVGERCEELGLGVWNSSYFLFNFSVYLKLL